MTFSAFGDDCASCIAWATPTAANSVSARASRDGMRGAVYASSESSVGVHPHAAIVLMGALPRLNDGATIRRHDGLSLRLRRTTQSTTKVTKTTKSGLNI